MAQSRRAGRRHVFKKGRVAMNHRSGGSNGIVSSGQQRGRVFWIALFSALALGAAGLALERWSATDVWGAAGHDPANGGDPVTGSDPATGHHEMAATYSRGRLGVTIPYQA